jgi:hypothetical protein
MKKIMNNTSVIQQYREILNITNSEITHIEFEEILDELSDSKEKEYKSVLFDILELLVLRRNFKPDRSDSLTYYSRFLDIDDSIFNKLLTILKNFYS